MNKPMTVQEFIQHVKNHDMYFIKYCEILINPKGEVILSRPSHTEAMVQEVMMLENWTREQVKESIPAHCNPLHFMCDKYNYCAIWYSMIITPLNVTKEQVATFNTLTDNHILDRQSRIDMTEEYWKHCWRVNMGSE